MIFQTYGIIIAFSVIISFCLVCLLHRENINTHIETTLLIVVAALFFSRLTFVITNIPYYFKEIAKPEAVFFINDGGLSLFGAILGVLLALFIIKKKNIINNFNHYVDSIALVFWLFVAIIRFAEKYTDMGIGKNVDVASIFTISDDYGFYVLTVYKIEALFAVLAFIVFAFLFYNNYKTEKRYNHPYILFLFITVFSSSQIVFESLRNDGHMLAGFIHVQEVLYSILLVYTIFYVISNLPKEQKSVSQKIKMIILSTVLVLIDFAMEFVIDGRLNLAINIGTSSYTRNYIIMSIVSLIFIIASISKIKKLKASSN